MKSKTSPDLTSVSNRNQSQVLTRGIRFRVILFLISLTFVFAPTLSLAESKPPAAQSPTHILFIGDSLTQGYGVRKEEAYPSLVEQKLKRSGYAVKVTNGSISGSVTAESDRRVRWFLKTNPQILVLALGSNDALKGTPPSVIKANLAKAIDLAQQNRIRVVLAGMKIFANFGADYAREFESLYESLAKEKDLPLIPFLLEGVAANKSLNLQDEKHPNAKGHERIAETVTQALEPLLGARPK